MDGMNEKSAKMGHDLFHPRSSYFFILPFDASSSEQMENREMEANYSGGQSSP
jgi:hypothetical protein